MKFEIQQKLSKCMLILMMVAMSSFAFAQTTVTGKITDAATGEALIGANVQVKGTSTGASTDMEGNYSVTVPADANTLVFSYTGYKDQEVEVNGQTTINVTLSEGVKVDELVVVGYGAVKKSDLTGSVVQVASKDFNQGIQVAPDQLIQGKVAGVLLLNNSGQPGGATTFRIRGNSSVRAGNNPLFVIDGVPLDGRAARPGLNAADLGNSPGTNPLSFLNPQDIATVDVLKDASATAIYGSRGSNGVVMITTKKGEPGSPRVNFSSSFGSSSLLKNYDVLDATEYAQALNDYGLQGGNGGADVDPMSEILQNNLTQNYALSVSGGGENSSFRVSASYLDQEGIIIGSDLKKYTGSIAGNFEFFDDRLTIDYNLVVGHVTENIAPISSNAGFTGSLVGQALQWNPTEPLYNDDGSYNILLGSTTINPVAMAEAYQDVANTTTLLGNISPSYKISDKLTYKFLYSILQSTGDRRAQIADWINVQGVEGRGWAAVGEGTLVTQQYTHTLNYNTDLSETVSLNALVGYEYMSFANSGIGMTAQDFLTDAVDYTDQLQGSDVTTRLVTSFKDPLSELQSYFARAIVNVDDKYLFTATLRTDGSSKFGENNQYGIFPSFAAAWNLHQEGFLPDAFDQLKLRLGWGQTGNQEFPAGAAQERYEIGENGALALSNVANPDLKWETSSTFNIAVDYGINNKFFGSIEYFYKSTTDILFNFAAIQPAPATRYWTNLDGEVINSGVEFSINAYLADNEDFSWVLGANISFLNNVLQNYDGPPVLTGALFGQGISGTQIQRLANDQPLNSFYLRDYTGLDDDGQSQYVDDGNTLFFLGDANPDVIYGLSTTFRYKSFDLTLNFNGALGYQVYNNTANTVLPIGNLGSRNIDANLLDGGVQEALANPITASDRYLEDADYLKLANATLGYSVGDVQGIKNIKLTLTGQNLFVLTGYTGFDPEVNTVNDVNGVPSLGIEYTPYPSARTILFGVSCNF